MSVVLQSFLANPYLRTHFLGDRHNRLSCDKTRAGEPCLSCELDLLFSEVRPTLSLSRCRRVLSTYILLTLLLVLRAAILGRPDAARADSVPALVLAVEPGRSRLRSAGRARVPHLLCVLSRSPSPCAPSLTLPRPSSQRSTSCTTPRRRTPTTRRWRARASCTAPSRASCGPRSRAAGATTRARRSSRSST